MARGSTSESSSAGHTLLVARALGGDGGGNSSPIKSAGDCLRPDCSDTNTSASRRGGEGSNCGWHGRERDGFQASLSEASIPPALEGGDGTRREVVDTCTSGYLGVEAGEPLCSGWSVRPPPWTPGKKCLVMDDMGSTAVDGGSGSREVEEMGSESLEPKCCGGVPVSSSDARFISELFSTRSGR